MSLQIPRTFNHTRSGCWLRRLIKVWSLFEFIIYVKVNSDILYIPPTFNHTQPYRYEYHDLTDIFLTDTPRAYRCR
jgi:hypothetical protein